MVCLLMPNRPEYMAIWLGLTRVGGVVALINTQLRGAVAGPLPRHGRRHTSSSIVAAEFAEALRTARAFRATPRSGCMARAMTVRRIDTAIDGYSPERRSRQPNAAAVTIADRALLIYTSGTTGLPKAANVSHHRAADMEPVVRRPDGRAAGRPALRLPAAVSQRRRRRGDGRGAGERRLGGDRREVLGQPVLGRHRRWDCTLFQYIGELCRYLRECAAAAARARASAAARLRQRPARRRLGGVPGALRASRSILEFYAATEGNFSLYNVEGKAGAIGRMPPFLAHRCSRGAGPVRRRRPARRRATATASASAARRRDRRGDRPDRRGDARTPARVRGLHRRAASETQGAARRVRARRRLVSHRRPDAHGRARAIYYFVDRIGDTFRWKGENVATSEVADAIMRLSRGCGGRRLRRGRPGCRGRGGNGGARRQRRSRSRGLRRHLAPRLPPYARPLFLRIKKDIDVTSTFKHKKSDLAREGFDPATTSDTLYFDDRERQAYVPLDAALHARIVTGAIRL